MKFTILVSFPCRCSTPNIIVLFYFYYVHCLSKYFKGLHYISYWIYILLNWTFRQANYPILWLPKAFHEQKFVLAAWKLCSKLAGRNVWWSVWYIDDLPTHKILCLSPSSQHLEQTPFAWDWHSVAKKTPQNK